MNPQEESKDSRKPKHDLESIADGMETEASEPKMPDFMKDADMLLALEAKRDKLIDQKNELSSASNVLELKPGAASGAIDKEINALQDKVNAVLGKYGKEANAFQVDAYRVGEMKENVADAEAMLKGMEAEYKAEKNPDKKKALERQMEDATAAWQEARNELAGMKDKYVAKEAAAKAELAGATEADVDAALEPLDEAGKTIDVDLSDLEETDEPTIEVGEVSDKEAEEIRNMDARERRIEAMGERVDAAMAAQDKMAEEDPIDIQGLMDIEAQRVQEEAQEKARAAKEKAEMAKDTEDALKMLKETSDEALAEEGKRDTLPDAGMAQRMENVAEGQRDTLVDEVMEVRDDEILPDVADTTGEQAFFAKGEVMNQAHEAGKTLEYRNKAERAGDAGAERAEMAQRAEQLRSEMPAMDQQLSRAEKVLSDLGVKDIDAMMADRAKGGLLGKAKGLLGGLFNKKTRELNRAMDLYASIRDQHNAKAEELGKIEMQLDPTERQKAMSRIAAENRQGK